MRADGRSGDDSAAVAVSAAPYPFPRASFNVATFSTATTPRLVNAIDPVTGCPLTAPTQAWATPPRTLASNRHPGE